MKKVSVIIVAAGEGRRFGCLKQFERIKDKPVLDLCLERFDAHKRISEIVLVIKDDSIKEKYLRAYRKVMAVARGGGKRQDSVYSGIQLINPENAEITLVHDGVRPLINEALVNRVIEAAETYRAAIPVLPVEDTIKIVDGEKVSKTLDRETLFKVQTPQGFDFSLLKRVLEKAKEKNHYATDEAALIEWAGQDVYVVPGDPQNIKITSPPDLKTAEVLLEY
jgi:2-C-methyl-D-erythritol 4-phosphate cytidylyltransferase